MIKENAETQDISGRCDKRINQDQPSGLGEVRDDSSINRLKEQSGSAASDCTGGDTYRANVEYGDSPAGKLLSRLELLEKAFYGYVHGHQERLKTRYKESTELESAFTEELQVIKQGLRDLAQQVEDDSELNNNEKP
ncbi:MAG: hypothetical protein RMX68_005815 [Aulosira sp. ZfuVER01]|nr:hypothetical protein [Aulosira sp. ZfuVER01]MDZ8000491.1 hypothetical protein [Aulosira sp. DedVER01a]MDZ8052963.1 hypothetical protein [Aulosira sp. ZfuCHP01]